MESNEVGGAPAPIPWQVVARMLVSLDGYSVADVRAMVALVRAHRLHALALYRAGAEDTRQRLRVLSDNEKRLRSILEGASDYERVVADALPWLSPEAVATVAQHLPHDGGPRWVSGLIEGLYEAFRWSDSEQDHQIHHLIRLLEGP